MSFGLKDNQINFFAFSFFNGDVIIIIIRRGMYARACAQVQTEGSLALYTNGEVRKSLLGE